MRSKDARGGAGLGVCIRADEDGSVALDRDGLHLRIMLVNGVDVGVFQDQVAGPLLRGGDIARRVSPPSDEREVHTLYV